MKQLEPDLWQTSARSIADGVSTHAFFLTLPTGNLLIYGIGEGRETDLNAMEQLGGVTVQVLSHRDEAGPSLNQIRERFGSRLACGALEKAYVRQEASVDLVVGPDCVDPALGDLEILDTPGHSDGSISFRYESPHGKTYLFTGDTILPVNGKWQTFVVEEYGGSFEAIVNSLELLRDQQPDLVLSSAFVGESGAEPMTPDDWSTIVDQRRERLRQLFGV